MTNAGGSYKNDGEVRPGGVLRAENIHAGYSKDIEILRGLSVSAQRAKITCIVGPNGTGKSTLLKTIFGFLAPSQGRILLDNEDIGGLPPHLMLKKGVVYLPQRPSLFPFLDVETNLKLGLWNHNLSRSTVNGKLDQVYQRFPVVKEKRKQSVRLLSGGQQRQVEFARSLLSDPLIYLIDEPTAGIDPKTSAGIYRLIKRMSVEFHKTILLVDQKIKDALELCNYVYVLRSGQVVEEGGSEEYTEDVSTLVHRWLHSKSMSENSPA